jgi:peptide methionine sulfoxide reductase msrA/msrB
MLNFTSDTTAQENNMKTNSLSDFEKWVIEKKGTERPFSGEYYDYWDDGEYTCKRCGTPLFRSENKFDAQCGWPSFDDEIQGAVRRQTDADGSRIEILCNNCDAHLGHVFLGEGFTEKNTRHCVNSTSLSFVPLKIERQNVIFAGGCFWGVEFYLQKENGVMDVISGYTGGWKEHPTYKEVSSGNTGHFEAVKVVYDPSKTNFETLVKVFFEIHDPTQANGQGPDIGPQYRSAVFYQNTVEKEIIEDLIKQLKAKGFKTSTLVLPASVFWVAEDYHQDYYEHKGTMPYCHFRTKRF